MKRGTGGGKGGGKGGGGGGGGGGGKGGGGGGGYDKKLKEQQQRLLNHINQFLLLEPKSQFQGNDLFDRVLHNKVTELFITMKKKPDQRRDMQNQ